MMAMAELLEVGGNGARAAFSFKGGGDLRFDLRKFWGAGWERALDPNEVPADVAVQDSAFSCLHGK